MHPRRLIDDMLLDGILSVACHMHDFSDNLSKLVASSISRVM